VSLTNPDAGRLRASTERGATLLPDVGQ
jgi:hypothetical protein